MSILLFGKASAVKTHIITFEGAIFHFYLFTLPVRPNYNFKQSRQSMLIKFSGNTFILILSRTRFVSPLSHWLKTQTLLYPFGFGKHHSLIDTLHKQVVSQDSSLC